MFTVSHAYQPRPIRLLGVRTVPPRSGGGAADSDVPWRIRVYTIVWGDAPFDYPGFERAWEQAVALLPAPAMTPHRPGVGFAILHQGCGADYLVLAWWDRENELPLRILVRDRATATESILSSPPRGPSSWRQARDSESICVWDAQVIAAERDAYVGTVLAASGSRCEVIEAYLSRPMTPTR